MNTLSQRTLVRMMELFGRADSRVENAGYAAARRAYRYHLSGGDSSQYWSRVLFEHDFPDWFIKAAPGNTFTFYWDRIIRDLRSGQFFWGEWGPIIDPAHAGLSSKDEFPLLAEYLLERLAAVAVAVVGPDLELPTDELERSLEHDGFIVDRRKTRVIPGERPVSHDEEESRLAQLIGSSGLPRVEVSKKHLSDAVEQYVAGTKDHSSLGESRSLLQSLLDVISEVMDGTGKSVAKLPGGTANRLEYLEKNGL